MFCTYSCIRPAIKENISIQPPAGDSAGSFVAAAGGLFAPALKLQYRLIVKNIIMAVKYFP
jgi:hypothetical protein